MEQNVEIDQVSRVLVLVPTEREMKLLPLAELRGCMRRDEQGGDRSADRPVLVSRCGFGSVAAAARTMELVRGFQPDAVLLAGIAGTYGIPKIEEAGCFRRVALADLGANGPAGVILPSRLNLPQWSGDDIDSPIFETLPLCQADEMTCWDQLVTVNVAAGSERDAGIRRGQFPGADAEDMEGFGVALACAMTHTPVTIVRGISNRVGDRTVAQWRIEEALAQVDRLVTNWCLRRLRN